MVYEVIGKLLAAACFVLLAYLTPKVKEWLEARTGKDHYDQLMQLVQAFARAVEQLYHNTDPSGEARNRFVREQLEQLGVEITETVVNMIEGTVWEINTETRKAQVQAEALTGGGGYNE